MKTVSIETLSPALRKTARGARRELVVLTDRGKPIAALVSVQDELALEALSLRDLTSFSLTWRVLEKLHEPGLVIRLTRSKRSSQSCHADDEQNARATDPCEGGSAMDFPSPHRAQGRLDAHYPGVLGSRRRFALRDSYHRRQPTAYS